VNERRRQRYHSDPEYRERVLASVRKSKQRRRAERREQQQGEARIYRMTPKGLVQVWRIGDVAEQIGRGQSTIRGWHRVGWLPPPTLPGKHRVYAAGQIKLMRELAAYVDERGYEERPLEKSKAFRALQKRIQSEWGTK
jgi:hypothetical protein